MSLATGTQPKFAGTVPQLGVWCLAQPGPDPPDTPVTVLKPAEVGAVWARR